MIFRWVHVLNNSRTEALEKAFGDSDKAEVLVSVVLVMKEVVLLHPTNHFSSWNVAKKMISCFFLSSSRFLLGTNFGNCRWTLLKLTRPFYRYGGHVELIRSKRVLWDAQGDEHDPLYSFSIRNMVFHYIFLGKKAIIITSKHCTTIFFPITILF